MSEGGNRSGITSNLELFLREVKIPTTLTYKHSRAQTVLMFKQVKAFSHNKKQLTSSPKNSLINSQCLRGLRRNFPNREPEEPVTNNIKLLSEVFVEEEEIYYSDLSGILVFTLLTGLINTNVVVL